MIKEKWCMPPLEGTFFQIVNMNGNHWVLLTNLHQKDPDCVLAYDSFYGRGKADSTDFAEIGAYDQSLLSAVQQLKPMARTLRIAKTEQQKDIVNCGVHALFNAWCLITSKMSIVEDINFVRAQIRLSFLYNRVQNLQHVGAQTIGFDDIPTLKYISIR